MWNYIKESQIDLSDLIPRVYNLDKINMAIQDLKEGMVKDEEAQHLIYQTNIIFYNQ